MNDKQVTYRDIMALNNRLRMAQNQGKPANSTNNVSFAELMRKLKEA